MLFESSLGFAGILIALWTGTPLYSRLEITAEALRRGVLASLPMFLFLGVVTMARWAPLVRLRRQVESLVRELFAESHWVEIAMISFAAGLGEEVLFRGALQPWIASWTNPLFALCAVSVLFGLAHSISTIYFLVATLVGFYLGWLALAYDDLLAPILAHSLYDFFALVYLQRRVGLQRRVRRD